MMHVSPMTLEEEFAEWVPIVPPEMREDVLWRSEAYRLATFAADRSWDDVTKLAADRRTYSMADQLSRALGSIGVNYAEGYSRSSGPDRCRIFEYGLGSAREARDWYFKGRRVVGEERARQSITLITQVLRLLTTTIVRERTRRIRKKRRDGEEFG